MLPTLNLREDAVLLVDPPRDGLHPKAAQFIAQQPQKKLVYVACAPRALVRDRALLEVGGWILKHLWSVDLFPQTPHVEIVALFTKENLDVLCLCIALLVRPISIRDQQRHQKNRCHPKCGNGYWCWYTFDSKQSELVIIDVRHPKNMHRDTFVGARNIPLNTLESQLEALEPHKDKTLYLVCAVGGRSHNARVSLSQKGFSKNQCTGGTRGWKAKGYPTE